MDITDKLLAVDSTGLLATALTSNKFKQRLQPRPKEKGGHSARTWGELCLRHSEGADLPEVVYREEVSCLSCFDVFYLKEYIYFVKS